MSDIVIKVDALSKKYFLHHKQERYTAFRDVITGGVKNLGRKLLSPVHSSSATGSQEEFFALNNVSFDVREGDRVGIIGRNGAGKSTLLKILSRITEPTTGRVEITGRVASLLEVGTGFHPELTGRENIYLNGAILGMSRAEIRAKFDEIVAFAEVDKFLDTPVKRYSSGMYVRLAFAVAAHLEPEILVVDEVLAVGDVQFQKKCLGKMREVSKGGRTVLFVSHNMPAIKSLCSNVILLSSGQLVKMGPVDEVVNSFLESALPGETEGGEVFWTDLKLAPGGNEMRLVSIRLLDSKDTAQAMFDTEKPVKVEVTYRLFEKVRGMRLILQIINSDGVIAFASTDQNSRPEENNPGLYRTICIIPERLLNSGIYFVRIHSGCPGVKVLVPGKEFVRFYTEKTSRHGSFFPEKWSGVVAPELTWKTEVLA